MENPWAVEFCEVPILESEGKDSIDEHGSFFPEIPQEPCSFNASLESGMLCASSAHKDCSHLKILSCKTFRRLHVDAYCGRTNLNYTGSSTRVHS
jgi:hypothetical protein